jgi:hypothetical protein
MDRPGFLPRKPKLPQDLAQAGDMIAMAEPLLDKLRDIRSCPGRDAVTFGARAAQDEPPQARLLPIGQARASAFRPVRQAGQTLGVVADHGVAQRLTLHAGQPGRFGARHAFQRMGDGEGARGSPRVTRPLRPGPQLRRRPFVADRKACHATLPQRQ